MTCPQTSTLGVYLLGALEPEDRSSFESHLHGCDICRAELVRLAPLPGLLNQISLIDFEEPGAVSLAVLETEAPSAPSIELPDLPPVDPPVVDPPPPEPVAKPDTPSEARPRRRFWVAAAAAAAVVAITVATILGYAALQQDPPAAQPVTWSATSVNGIKAEVQLTQTDWGTDIRVWMSNVPPGKECKLVVMARNGYEDTIGYREIAGWWKTGHETKPGVPGSTSIDLNMIYKLQFIDNDDIHLVDIPAPH